MKPIVWMTLIGLLALALTGCGSASQAVAPEAPDTDAATTLDTSYENALALRNQLALGTLQLEDTSWPVTGEQADGLLLLWQALRGTTGSGAAAPEEVDALLDQIEGAMTAEQVAAIGAMRLTQADLQVWAQGQGLATGTGTVMGSGQPGGGQSLSPEERATRQAEREAAGGAAGGGTRQAVIDAVLGLLESR